MDVFQFRPFEPARRPPAVLTIGNFDGVHLGHQALIRQVVREARKLGVGSALMTFQPHPQSVLRDDPPPVITSMAMRRRLFERLGLDAAYFVPFTREFAKLSAETFVQDYLLRSFQVRKIVIGFDFHFGHKREGSAQVLERLSAVHGFAFEVFPEVALGEDKVSSSRIREALQRADFAEAERFLGRPWSVLERVVRGAQRGRTLGFPTLNQVPAESLPLPFGVYACRAIVRERTYGAVANYGVRPTVAAGGPVAAGVPVAAAGPVLETHLLDFDAGGSAEVYGEQVEVTPLRRLRDERKFPSLDALRRQIAQDRDAARGFLRQAGPSPA